jgi:hypothetical protein
MLQFCNGTPAPALQEYKEVFEPLLLEEAGAQVLRGIEEGVVIEPHESVVAACSKVGSCYWHVLPLRPQPQQSRIGLAARRAEYPMPVHRQQHGSSS